MADSAAQPPCAGGTHIPSPLPQERSTSQLWRSTRACAHTPTMAHGAANVPRHTAPPKQTHLGDLWFARQAVRQVLQLSHPVRQPDWQLLLQELGGKDQLPLDGVGPEVQLKGEEWVAGRAVGVRIFNEVCQTSRGPPPPLLKRVAASTRKPLLVADVHGWWLSVFQSPPASLNSLACQ